MHRQFLVCNGRYNNTTFPVVKGLLYYVEKQKENKYTICEVKFSPTIRRDELEDIFGVENEADDLPFSFTTEDEAKKHLLSKLISNREDLDHLFTELCSQLINTTRGSIRIAGLFPPVSIETLDSSLSVEQGIILLSSIIDDVKERDLLIPKIRNQSLKESVFIDLCDYIRYIELTLKENIDICLVSRIFSLITILATLKINTHTTGLDFSFVKTKLTIKWNNYVTFVHNLYIFIYMLILVNEKTDIINNIPFNKGE